MTDKPKAKLVASKMPQLPWPIILGAAALVWLLFGKRKGGRSSW